MVGWVLRKLVLGGVHKGFERSELSPLLEEFIRRLLGAMLWVLIILSALGPLGVDTAELIGAFAVSMGLILGIGLQDSFQNLAAGAWLATTRPIAVEETVQLVGQQSRVVAVGLMSTTLLTADGIRITIPNGSIWGQPVLNHSREPVRRVAIDVGIAYGADLQKAMDVTMALMAEDEQVLDDPGPAVWTTALADSSINLQLRAWTNTDDMWDAKSRLMNDIVRLFVEAGIEIPFPQMSVRVVQES